ncbi:MAG: hypothetical protein ACYC09_05190 [Bacteroidota bacterium]
MEKPSAKIFLFLFCLSAAVWGWNTVMMNVSTGSLLEFGTLTFLENLNPGMERTVYADIAERSLYSFAAYPLVIISAIGFLKTTRRSLKYDGWLLMSAVLILIFIPVEIYCLWLDWKIVGLQYWGEWPIEEFRKALIARVTALAGLPFIAQLCYLTIPVIVIFKPLSQQQQHP